MGRTLSRYAHRPRYGRGIMNFALVNTLVNGSEELNRKKKEIKTIIAIILGLAEQHPLIRGGGWLDIELEVGLWEIRQAPNRKLIAVYSHGPVSGVRDSLYASSAAGPEVGNVLKVHETLPRLIEKVKEDAGFNFAYQTWPYFEAAKTAK